MHPKQWFLAWSMAVLTAAPLASQTLTPGPEIQVSVASFEHPRETVPALAVAPGGGFLSAWLDHGLRVRGISPADVPLGPVQKLNGAPSNPGPAVVALGPGRYAAVWADGTLRAQVLDAAGAPAGPPLVLAQHAVNPVVAPHPAGGFVVLWTDIPDFPPPGLPLPLPLHLVRRFDAQAQPVGDEILLAPLADVSGLAALPGGGFAVAWSRTLVPSDGGTIEVYLSVFAADGTPAGPQTTLSADADNPWLRAGVGADSAGRFVVAWTEFPTPDFRTRVWARRFSPAGQPLGPPILVAEKQGSFAILGDVAVRPDGSFLIEWGETPAVSGDLGTERGDALARAFDAAGTPLGPALLVHTAQDGQHQESEGEAEATAEGWIVSWTRFGDSRQGVYARRLSLSCGTGSELCLGNGRFRLTARWRVPASGASGQGFPLGLAADTGSFWFFAPTNTELVVKVLDGRGLNGHFWVFYGSLTNVEFDLAVTDTATGRQRTYHNPAGTMASRADTEAFPQ